MWVNLVVWFTVLFQRFWIEIKIVIELNPWFMFGPNVVGYTFSILLVNLFPTLLGCVSSV